MLWCPAPRRQRKHHGLVAFKLLWCSCLLALASIPQRVWAPLYKIGVVGPWTCDPLFSNALPEVAAGLVIERINRDSSFDAGCSFEYVILNEDGQTARALCSFIVYHQMASGFIGPVNPGTARPPRSWETVGTKGFSLGLV